MKTNPKDVSDAIIGCFILVLLVSIGLSAIAIAVKLIEWAL